MKAVTQEPPEGSPPTSREDRGALHGLVFFALLAASSAIPHFQVWPLFWLAPLAAYAVLVGLISALRSSFRPWRFGESSTSGVVSAIILAVASSGILIAFHFLLKPEVGHFGQVIPVSKMGGLLLAGILFSVGNAVIEEIIFRGLLFDAVASQWGRWGAVTATAVLFGYGHRHGYPAGMLGAFLAGVYGLCLGWLRVFTHGLGLPILAHIVADATIFCLVAQAGGFTGT